MTLNKYKPWAMLSWPLRATDWKHPVSFGPYDAKHYETRLKPQAESYSPFGGCYEIRCKLLAGCRLRL
jgi:hypothetical protein